MTTKKPELTVNLQTTLQKFGGFVKILAFIAGMGGVGAGSTYLSDKYINDTEINRDRTRDSLITVLQNKADNHESRINSIEATNVEIKSDLTIIRSDLKTILYQVGKLDGRTSK